MDIVVEPFSVAYDGKDADENVIHSHALGESIVGGAKVYTAVMHYCAYGYVPRGNYKKHFACYSKPPTAGSFEYSIFLATIASEWTLHGPIYRAAFSLIFARVVAAVKSALVRKGETVQVAEALANALVEQARRNAEVNLVLANGLVKANDNLTSLQSKLIDTLPQLASAARPGAKQLVTPIGTTCRTIVQFKGNQTQVTIGEAEAEAIRDESVEVHDMQKFNCQLITEVNTQTGHCILVLEGFKHPVIGKITDPSLELPNNIYTRSLNERTPFQVSAKPVKRDGEISKIFISDAKKG